MPQKPGICPDCGGKRAPKALRCHRCACVAKRGRRIASPPPGERVWRFVEKTATCWVWTGGLSGTGYGLLSAGGNGHRGGARKLTAHRFIYELIIGEIPPGLDLDHLCGNRRCVNPAHLEPVSRRENLRRAGIFDRRDALGRFGRQIEEVVESTGLRDTA